MVKFMDKFVLILFTLILLIFIKDIVQSTSTKEVIALLVGIVLGVISISKVFKEIKLRKVEN